MHHRSAPLRMRMRGATNALSLTVSIMNTGTPTPFLSGLWSAEKHNISLKEEENREPVIVIWTNCATRYLVRERDDRPPIIRPEIG